MLLKKSSIVYEQVNTGDTGGGGLNAQAVPQVPPPAPSSTQTKEEGSIEYDELGYAKAPATPPAPNQTPKTPEPAAATPPAPEVNTGYNTPPPPPELAGYVDPAAAPVTPPAPAEPNAAPVVELVDLKELSDTDKKTFGEYFTQHKLTKEAQQALVNMRKNEVVSQQNAKVAQEKQVQAQVTKLKSDWFNELKADKDFGGANFDANTKMVNKFINDFMPNTKKMLTEKGGMLPPNTMRDFYSVAKKLYETEGFVQGDGSAASETKPTDQWKFLGDMYASNN